MTCDWCKKELASDAYVALLNISMPMTQEEARESMPMMKEELREYCRFWPGGYIITVCMDCAGLLDDLFGRLIIVGLEAACPICNAQHKEAKEWDI